MLLLLAALLLQAAPATSAADPLVYFVSESVDIRAEPDRAARRVGRLRRFDVVSGRETVPGWLHVDPSADTSGRGGWIPLARENVVTGTLEQVRARLFHIERAKWPERVKLDVARGLIRPGYTAAQVRLALGDPVRKDLRHVGDDVAEEWTYPDRRVIFSHTAVAAIERTPQR